MGPRRDLNPPQRIHSPICCQTTLLRPRNFEESLIVEAYINYMYCYYEKSKKHFLFTGRHAGVAKLGQRRKIQSLVLSGSRVQIPSPA